MLEIATPYSTVAQQSALPRLSTSKFPERFGLFTIIVLGESVVVTLTAITATGVGISVAIVDSAECELADPSRYLLVGSVGLVLLGIAGLRATLARAPDEPTHVRLSPGLKVVVAALIGILGALDLGWSTPVLLAVVLGGLAVPMAYGAVVWFTQPITGPDGD